MATPTKLESKLAEVLGLAMAAQDALREVRGMLGSEHEALDKRLVQARDDARAIERRCKALAATFRARRRPFSTAPAMSRRTPMPCVRPTWR